MGIEKTEQPMSFARQLAVKRVLIYRLGSFGDTVVALPALRLVAQQFPHAERRMLTNMPVHGKAPPVSAVLGGSGLVHGYISYPVGTRSPLTLARVAWQIRAFRPEVLVYLAKPRGEQVLERDRRFFRYGCGVHTIVGLPTGDRGRNLPPSIPGGFWESEGARLARSVSTLGVIDTGDLRNWDLSLTEAEHTEAISTLTSLAGRPLIACGPGTKMQAKDWGDRNWRALLSHLAEALPEHGLVLVGAKDDSPVAEFCSQSWRGRVLNLCGITTPRVTAAVLARTELFMGPDSGPMHVAGAVGVPCAIAFASRTEPGMWFPPGPGHQVVYHRLSCSNCDLETCIVNERRCLSSISPEEMFQAAMTAWRDGCERRAATV